MSFLLFALQAISKTNTCYVLLSHIFFVRIIYHLCFSFFLPNSTFFSRPSWPASLAAISKSVVEDELLTSFSFGIFEDTDDTFVHLSFLQFFLQETEMFFFSIPPLGVAVGNVKNTKAHFGLYESYAGFFFFFFFPCCNCVGTKCARNSFAHKEHGKTMTSQDR